MWCAVFMQLLLANEKYPADCHGIVPASSLLPGLMSTPGTDSKERRTTRCGPRCAAADLRPETLPISAGTSHEPSVESCRPKAIYMRCCGSTLQSDQKRAIHVCLFCHSD
ncbi:hypothetical protein LZ31DRAFT_265160 [Colletotrichum somersetense]|nr:hypothetical protein LZ31DRAFT_265160 [Colletotrichum somersetense]